MPKFYISIKRIFLILLITFSCQTLSYSQSAKKLRLKIDSILKKEYSKYEYIEWVFCNKDNVYYNSTKLELYTNFNVAYGPESCCEFFLWRFENKKRFFTQKVQVCNEPATASISDTKKFKLIHKIVNNKLLLLKHGIDSDERFEVINVEHIVIWNNQNSDKITLVRVP